MTTKQPSVHAVCTCQIKIFVRASNSGETLQQMYDAAQREAEGILRNNLPNNIQVQGAVTFLHAVVTT